MMNFTTNSFMGWGGFHVHMLFGLVLILGAIFLVMWASKNLNKKELANWTLWLLVIGAVGTLLTANMGGSVWSQMHGNNDLSSEDWQKDMLEEMEEHMGL